MSLRVNTLANFSGRMWTAALGALLIPVYVSLLGIEAYALVGISATLTTIFGLLDLGMSAAFSREISRLEAFHDREQDERDLLATFDLIYASLAAVIGLAIALLAPVIATKWVTQHSLDPKTIVVALRLIGVSVAFQLPTSFYFGGLIALERQVLYNIITVTSATVRGIGAIAILLVAGATVEHFFAWQVFVSIATAIAVGFTTHRLIDRRRGRGRFRFALVRSVGGYAAGWFTTTASTSLASQIDKVVLTRVLPLAQFGYYTLASAVATLLWNVVVPVTAAAMPRFNRTIAAGDEERLRHEYFSANELLALILVPISAIVMIFPRHVLMLWTRDPVMTAASERLIVIFAAGMTISGLANLALNLCLAHGRFGLPLTITICAAVITTPVMIVGGTAWGAAGGALGWAMQMGSVIVLVPLFHRHTLRGDASRWLTYTVAMPGLAAASVCALAFLVRPPAEHLITSAVFLLGTWMLASFAVVMVEPDLRASVGAVLRERRIALRLAKGNLK